MIYIIFMIQNNIDACIKYIRTHYMNLFDLTNDMMNIVFQFSGHNETWKTRFSNDVLPKIDAGHKIVGVWFNEPTAIEGTACGNCYLYANTEAGNGEFCMNCMGNAPGQYTTMSFADHKAAFQRNNQKLALMDAFEDYEDFKRWRNVEKIRIDNYLPTLCKKDFIKVLFKWELQKTVKLIN